MSELSLLRDLEDRTTHEFAARRQVLGFDDYFALFLERPRQQLRTAPEYLRDCLLHYGTETVERPGIRRTRYRLFDCPWQNGKDRVIGQEDVQQALFRLLQNFIRERRVTRLVMLHGPNGSAKSSLIECLGMGLEHYSTTDEGAAYRFNWVFPSTRVSKKRLGFGEPSRQSLQSYALLDDDDVDARLPADLRDHPLLLLPKAERRALIEKLQGEGRLKSATGNGEPLAEHFLEGDLSPRSRAIFDALMTAYQGDMQRVFQHVQVTRFTYSRRYRHGLVTIEPQMHVDAGIRQVTMDQGLGSLPPALRHLSLFEPTGDLVDANRGIVHFNDLLKRPIDAFKYLLATCEKGTVALSNAILHLDTVMLATSNEMHLKAFKEYPDFASFKGRMDLVRMAYLLDFETERRIYDEHLEAAGLMERVVPHATLVLALWAVLTRLKRPRPEAHDPRLRDVLTRLTPFEKAELYAAGRPPKDATAEQGRELLSALPELLREGADAADAEGLSGASPREMKQVLLNVLQDPRYWGLSPLGVIAELREHVKLKSVYDYLQQKRDGAWHDHEGFIDQVFSHWLELVDAELRAAMGLVEEKKYEELFARYLLHVSYLQKNEKIWNEKTKSYEAPDAGLMAELERTWGLSGDTSRFRGDLVSRVGAWRIEHPGDPIPWRQLFPKLITTLEEDYYGKQKARVERQLTHCLAVLQADRAAAEASEGLLAGLSASDIARARETLDRFRAQHGYPEGAISETLVALRKYRY
jgi:serine protein kinase